MRVLVIEDENGVREQICFLLKDDGYAVDAVPSAADGAFMLKENDYDVAVLDIMLPDGSGLDILSSFRKTGKKTPILILSALGGLEVLKETKPYKPETEFIILTAVDEVPTTVKALKLGAYDYLVKPFEPAELLARVRVLVRRKYSQPDPLILVHDLSINTRTRDVKRGDRHIELKPKEYSVLEILARNIGAPVTRTMMWEHLYDWDYDGMSNTVDVYVSRLRAKIDLPNDTPLIHTVRGVGYMLSEKET